MMMNCVVLAFLSVFKSARYRPAQSGHTGDALPHSVGALQKNASPPAGVVSGLFIVFNQK